jgi:hypothetical protein
MRHVLKFLIILSYFTLVVAILKHSTALYISGYSVLAIAHLMLFLIELHQHQR